MGDKSFLFEEPVNLLPKNNEDMMFRRPPSADIKLVQNGYELHYEDKEFIAENLDEALKLIKGWMEKFEKDAKENEEGNSDHEE